MQQAGIEQKFNDGGSATGPEHVLGYVLSARSQIGNVWSAAGDASDIVEIEVNSRFVRHRRKMKRRVRRSSGRCDIGGGIFECL